MLLVYQDCLYQILLYLEIIVLSIENAIIIDLQCRQILNLNLEIGELNKLMNEQITHIKQYLWQF